MTEETYATSKLREVLTATPEEAVPARKAFELLAAATVGHRISRYGTKYLLVPAMSALGDTTGVTALKDYSDPISRGIAGGVSALLLFVLRGKWSRAIDWGVLFENVEASIDYIESIVAGSV